MMHTPLEKMSIGARFLDIELESASFWQMMYRMQNAKKAQRDNGQWVPDYAPRPITLT